jgi:hypothetical protein
MRKKLTRNQCYYIYNLALKYESLKRGEQCVECGSTKNIHGHHDNYQFPLDVTWLCPSCHKKRHPSISKMKKRGTNVEHAVSNDELLRPWQNWSLLHQSQM